MPTPAPTFVCVDCGASNPTESGPCVACRSTGFRGDRDARAASEIYHKVADTVGLVPNVRWKDNLYQGITVAVITGIAALIGLALNGGEGALLGTLLGLVAGFLASGIVLMVVGWVRLVRRR